MAFSNSLIGFAAGPIAFNVAGTVAATSAAFGALGGAAPVSGSVAATSAAFGSVGLPGSPYSNSLVGYATNTLIVPVAGAYPVWGNPVAVTATVFGAFPTAAYSDSNIGYSTGSLNNPGTAGNSRIGFASTTVGGTSVTVPPAQVNLEPGSVVTLTGSGGDAGGTISWTQVSGPATSFSVNGSVATVTCPAAVAATRFVLRYAVNVAFGDVTLDVLPVTERTVQGGVEVPLVIYT